MTDKEKDDWIEADFQQVVAETTRSGKRKRAKHVGCPLEFLVDVCRLTRGRTALVLALHVYRRTRVCRGETVTLDGAELAELGVGPRRRRETLHNLEAAGIVRLRQPGPGQKTAATLLWRPASS
jgi:hypothetical protein